MKKCKKCGKEVKNEVMGFCSKKCVSVYFDNRIAVAMKLDKSHIKDLT